MTTLRKFITELGYKTDQRSFRAAEADTESLRQELRSLSSQAGSAGRALTGAIAGFVSFQAGSSLLKGIVAVNVENQKLTASLETLEGSAEGAEAALAKITDFTTTTPFQINEVATAFIKLKQLGLDASEDSLRSFGNTAAAMGKPLEQLIEAVADAASGEFERLKEFGIKSSKEGDKVKFTFKGVTTSMKNDANTIQNFLKDLGDQEFGGAMEKQMNTLGGRFSNLSDTSTQFAIAVGKGGLNDAIFEVTGAMLEASKGSDSLAASIGEGLGEAVRGTAEAFSFLAAHAEEVRVVLIGLGAVLATQKLMSFAAAVGAVAAQFGALGSVIAKTGLLLAANPIFLLAGVLVGAVAAIVIFREEIAAWANETASAGGVLGAVAGIIQTFTNDIIPAFVETISSIWQAFAPLLDILGEVFGAFMSIISAVLPPILQLVAIITKIRILILASVIKVFAVLIKPILFMVKLIAKVLAFVAKIVGKFVAVIAKVAAAIIEPIAAAFDAVFGVISGWVDIASNVIFGFFDSVMEIGASILDPVKDAFDGFVNFLRKIVRQIPTSLLSPELQMFAFGISQSDIDELDAREARAFGERGAGLQSARLLAVARGETGVSATTIEQLNVVLETAPEMSPSEVRTTFVGGVKDVFDKPSTAARDFSTEKSVANILSGGG